jgi:Protein of unknown function (DUF3180)
MQPTKFWSLLVIGGVCAVVAWLTVWATFANLPPLPWTAVPAFVLLAVAELLLGRNLRTRLAGRGDVKPVQPIVVPRIVALAKASSAAAAAFCGLALGMVIYAVGSLGKPVPRHDVLAAGFTAVAAFWLAVAALYLERSCRAPEPPSDSDDLFAQNGHRGRSG